MEAPHLGGKRTAIVANGKRRIQTTFDDGAELVEEYDVVTDELVTRKWRGQGVLGGDGRWQFEIGDPPESMAAIGGGGSGSGSGGQGGGGLGMGVGMGGASAGGSSNDPVMRASSSNPSWHARDRIECWEWRVRNLPYPAETYSVTVKAPAEGERVPPQLVLRTTNKKFFKRWTIPAMLRHHLPLEQEAVEFEHSDSTLVISYEKPESIREFEQALRDERRTAAEGGDGKDGDVEGCKTT
jgi:hypothetical protein